MKKQSDLKKVLLTFDYELFMGSRSGTVDNCLLRPTSEILDILKKNNGKAIFFIDTTFLSLLKKDIPEDFVRVKEQIKRMCHEGHLVELHIHPQWQDAYKISDKEWGFKKEMKYRLDLFKQDEIVAIFKESYNVLQSILSEAGPQYKLSAFRAGGWCLPPFSLLKPVFTELGLKYDLSVLPGSQVDNGIFQKYDYRSAPSDKTCWSFAEEVWKPGPGPFIEVPCTMVKFNRVSLVQNRLYMKKQRVYGDGAGAVHRKSRLTKIKAIFSNPYKPLTLDGYNESILFESINKMKLPVATLVGHPKSFGPLNMTALDKLTTEYQTILLQDLKV